MKSPVTLRYIGHSLWVREAVVESTCEVCGKAFQAKRNARICGPTCRKRASRKTKSALKPVPERRKAPVVPIPSPPEELPLVEATRRELEAAGRLDTALGQAAMRLAGRMHSEFDTGSALAALSKELRAVMAETLKDATPHSDSLDELAARRAKKAAGA